MDICSRLQVLQEAGFVFHGSAIRLTVIEPRKARDQTSEIGRSLAVYASDDYRFAIVKAVVQQCHPSFCYGWRLQDKHLHVRGYGVECKNGFVHVLQRSGFREIHDSNKTEIVSFQPATPVRVFAVNANDLWAMPNCTFELTKDILTPPNF